VFGGLAYSFQNTAAYLIMQESLRTFFVNEKKGGSNAALLPQNGFAGKTLLGIH
jgi:hypothetical protein